MLSAEAVEFFSHGAFYLGVLGVALTVFNIRQLPQVRWGNVLGVSAVASLILIGGPVLCLLAVSPLAS